MYTERATLLAAFVAVLLLGATKVAEFDIFFHLRLGADFLAQGSFLLQDTHSYPSASPILPGAGWPMCSFTGCTPWGASRPWDC